jgi:branched-subunit amino acid transport protein AzlD
VTFLIDSQFSVGHHSFSQLAIHQQIVQDYYMAAQMAVALTGGTVIFLFER